MARAAIETSRGHLGRTPQTAGDLYAPARGIEAVGTILSCVALGVILPFFVHIVGVSPRVLLPMHYSVLLAGALLSPLHAALVGIFAPAISMAITGMPTAEQTLRMIPELASYGAVVSLMLMWVPRLSLGSERVGRILALAVAMFTAMICGRLVYILMHGILSGFAAPNYYVGVLLAPAIPGLVAQLVLIPLAAYKLQRIMNR